MPTLKRETGVQLGHRFVQISCLIQQCRGGERRLGGREKSREGKKGCFIWTDCQTKREMVKLCGIPEKSAKVLEILFEVPFPLWHVRVWTEG